MVLPGLCIQLIRNLFSLQDISFYISHVAFIFIHRTYNFFSVIFGAKYKMSSLSIRCMCHILIQNDLKVGGITTHGYFEWVVIIQKMQFFVFIYVFFIDFQTLIYLRFVRIDSKWREQNK